MTEINTITLGVVVCKLLQVGVPIASRNYIITLTKTFVLKIFQHFILVSMYILVNKISKYKTATSPPNDPPKTVKQQTEGNNIYYTITSNRVYNY